MNSLSEAPKLVDVFKRNSDLGFRHNRHVLVGIPISLRLRDKQKAQLYYHWKLDRTQNKIELISMHQSYNN
jgi:hypothetical protein